MCPREGIKRYGTVAQVHGSWGCVRLRHNDRRWVLLDQLLARGSLPAARSSRASTRRTTRTWSPSPMAAGLPTHTHAQRRSRGD